MSTPTPPPSRPSGQIIWQRTVDEGRQRRRTRWLIRFAIAAAVVAAVVAVLVDPGSALGVVVIAAFVGAIASVFAFGTSAQERAGKTITLAGDSLVCRRITVPISAVASFTTYARWVVRGHHNGKAVKVLCGYAVFQLVDGSTRTFEWPTMPQDQIDGVRLALDKVLPGRWQPHPEV